MMRKMVDTQMMKFCSNSLILFTWVFCNKSQIFYRNYSLHNFCPQKLLIFFHVWLGWIDWNSKIQYIWPIQITHCDLLVLWISTKYQFIADYELKKVTLEFFCIRQICLLANIDYKRRYHYLAKPISSQP